MSETAVQFQQEEDQSTPAGEKSEPQGNKAPGLGSNVVITPEDIRNIVREETSKAFQGIQSMNSKMEKRIQDEMTRRIQAMQAAGIEPDEKQAQAIYHQTRRQIEESNKGESGNTPAQEKPQPPKTESDINVAAREMMDEYGFTIDTVEDPDEAKMIDSSSPRKFIKSLEKALEAKKERLEKAQETRAQATVPTMAASGRTVAPSEGNYLNELHAARGNRQQVLAVKEKYRNMGLDVDAIPIYGGR